MTRASRAPLVEPEVFTYPEFRHPLGTIVMTKGVYDLTHAGHVVSLWNASVFGDTLVVAVADDDSVRRRKGNGRPILSFRERLEIVASLRMVDYVVCYDDVSARAALFAIRPSYYCASHRDYLSNADMQALEELGVQFRTVPKPTERSTSNLIREIKELCND